MNIDVTLARRMVSAYPGARIIAPIGLFEIDDLLLVTLSGGRLTVRRRNEGDPHPAARRNGGEGWEQQTTQGQWQRRGKSARARAFGTLMFRCSGEIPRRVATAEYAAGVLVIEAPEIIDLRPAKGWHPTRAFRPPTSQGPPVTERVGRWREMDMRGMVFPSWRIKGDVLG